MVGDLVVAGAHAGEPLVRHQRRRVAVADLEAVGEQLPQQVVGHDRVGRRRPGPQHPHPVGQSGQPVVELEQQARLAHAGVAHHRDRPPHLLLHHLGEPVLQAPQLEGPTDCAGGHSLHPVAFRPERAGALGQHEERIDRRVDPLEVQAGAPLQREAAHDVAARVGRDEHAAGRCRGLQASRPVDGLTHDDEVGSRPLVQRAHHHLSGVDAHPHRQRQPVLVLELAVQRGELAGHRHRGAHGPLGVVLLSLVQPEHGHHGITDELLHHPALRLDDRVPPLEVAVDDRRERPRRRASGTAP